MSSASRGAANRLLYVCCSAAEDVPNADKVRTLVADIADVRSAKIRGGLISAATPDYVAAMVCCDFACYLCLTVLCTCSCIRRATLDEQHQRDGTELNSLILLESCERIPQTRRPEERKLDSPCVFRIIFCVSVAIATVASGCTAVARRCSQTASLSRLRRFEQMRKLVRRQQDEGAAAAHRTRIFAAAVAAAAAGTAGTIAADAAAAAEDEEAAPRQAVRQPRRSVSRAAEALEVEQQQQEQTVMLRWTMAAVMAMKRLLRHPRRTRMRMLAAVCSYGGTDDLCSVR